MHHLTLLTTLAFSLTVPVSSLVVPRATPPKGYQVDRLEVLRLFFSIHFLLISLH